MISERGLTPKQRHFCRQYILDFNGTRSYMKAYPNASEKLAHSHAHKMLKNDNIKAYISDMQRERANRLEIDGDLIVQELAKIITCDISDFYCELTGELLPPHELTGVAKKAIGSITTTTNARTGEKKITYKQFDKLKAIELLGKHLCLFEKEEKVKDLPPSKIVYKVVK